MAKIQIDVEEFNKAEVGQQKWINVGPGVYSVKIAAPPTEKFHQKTSKPKLAVDMVAVSGPEQETPDDKGSKNAAGRKLHDELDLAPQSMWRVKEMLVCFGLIKKTDKLSNAEFDTNLLAGQVGNVEVFEEPYEGKMTRKLRYLVGA
jgi:hypothetical protein